MNWWRRGESGDSEMNHSSIKRQSSQLLNGNQSTRHLSPSRPADWPPGQNNRRRTDPRWYHRCNHLVGGFGVADAGETAFHLPRCSSTIKLRSTSLMSSLPPPGVTSAFCCCWFVFFPPPPPPPPPLLLLLVVLFLSFFLSPPRLSSSNFRVGLNLWPVTQRTSLFSCQLASRKKRELKAPYHRERKQKQRQKQHRNKTKRMGKKEKHTHNKKNKKRSRNNWLLFNWSSAGTKRPDRREMDALICSIINDKRRPIVCNQPEMNQVAGHGSGSSITSVSDASPIRTGDGKKSTLKILG